MFDFADVATRSRSGKFIGPIGLATGTLDGQIYLRTHDEHFEAS